MSETQQSNAGKHIKDIIEKLKADLSTLGKNLDTISGAVSRHETDLLNIKSQKNVSENLKDNHKKFTERFNTNTEEMNNTITNINNKIDNISRELSNINNALKKVESDTKEREYKLENELKNKLDKAISEMETKLSSVTNQFYV